MFFVQLPQFMFEAYKITSIDPTPQAKETDQKMFIASQNDNLPVGFGKENRTVMVYPAVLTLKIARS